MECFALLLNTDCDRCPSCLPTFQFDISESLSLAVYQNSHTGVNSTSEDAAPELEWRCLTVVCSTTAQ